jgi:hypothetical protein
MADAHVYRSPAGDEVRLVVPYDSSGSGVIPPPSVEFWVGGPLKYFYSRTEEDVPG